MPSIQNLTFAGALLLSGLCIAARAEVPPQEIKMIAHEAVEGDPNAQLLYGLAYLEGRYELTPDAGKATYWLLRAAREDQPYAQLEMGKLYAAGKGVAKSAEHAVYWWRKAARLDMPEAQYLLGKARLEGYGGRKDPASAVHWLTKAAESGNHDAQFLLGKMYKDGYAVAQDVDLARDWLTRAAEAGHSEAINLLAVLNKLIKATTMVYRQSAEVLIKMAKDGDPQAQYELGLRYESGAWDVNKNNQRALYWLKKAADNGNHHAMATLAHVYERGELGVAKDPEQADYWKNKSKLH